MTALLYFFRHGSAARPGVMVGRSDIPLSPDGFAEADFWRKELSGVRFNAAWSSPLVRARQTAALILSGNPDNPQAEVVPELREISLGLWEGRDKTWAKSRFPEAWEARGRDMATVPPPEGESFAMLASRVLPVFAGLLAEASAYGRSLLVAHQAVNRVILAHIKGLPLDRVRDIPQPPGCLTVLALEAGGIRIVSSRNAFEAADGTGTG